MNKRKAYGKRMVKLLGLKTLSLLLSLCFFGFNASAQTSKAEVFYITTDRNLYVVGESINLKIFARKYEIESPNRAYLYCDFQGQDGSFYDGVKARIDSSWISLQLPIPIDMLSGNYIIRVYSQELKSEANSYATQWVRIVNPNTAKLLSVKESSDNVLTMDRLKNARNIKLEELAKTYPKRSKVECRLNFADANILPSSMTVSVVPKSSLVNTNISLPHNDDVNYYSSEETRGLLLQGQLISQTAKAKSPNLSGNRIYFSIRGSKDIISCISDSTGSFQIYLPDNYGKHEVYITTETLLEGVQIKVNRSYDTKTIFSLNKEFYLNKQELDWALLMAQNQNIKESFSQEDLEDSSNFSIRPFYDKPDEVIRINDYIDLDDLGMYFTELPGNVHLHKRNDKYEMRIINAAGMQLFNSPLIMVDYVVVNDLQQVLKMNPKDINRIEIVREYYQKGDANFGGIVNFISNENDFASYEFSNSAISISYDFLTRNNIHQSVRPIENKPDARTTLLWMPNVNTNKSSIPLTFYTSDMSGAFMIVIQGLDKNGNSVYYSQEFVVE